MATSSRFAVRGGTGRGGAGVTVYGIQELIAKLEAINVIARVEVGGLLRIAAETIMDIASYNAPVETGNLSQSGDVQQTGPYTHIVTFNTTRGPVAEKNNIDYAGYVEFGTSKMDPEPFLGPATLEVEPMILAGLMEIAAHIESL